MTKINTAWLLLLSAFLFTILFYKQALGINLVIYEIAILSYLIYDKAIILQNKLHLIGTISVFLTVIFTALHHSTLSFFVNFSMFFLLIGFISAPDIRSIPLAAYNSLTSLIISQGLIRKEFKMKGQKSKRFSYNLKRLGIFLIPLLIIITFILIYSSSNPKFGEFFSWINTQISLFFQTLFEYIELNALLVLIFGIMISSFIFLRNKNKHAEEIDANSNDQLYRIKIRRRSFTKTLALYNEYRAAVFLFISLNILLLFLNSMDIYWVWFNFKWEGQFLKEFVHQGTFLLLISIVLSIVLVLYFFRKNINFYRKNSFLKKITYFWLLQNAILVISVGIRNWYYIQYYALAYKRIAIVFFLILTLFALYTVYKKISKVKSSYYMLRVNSLALVCILVFSAAFNWDKIIAKYNFSKSDRSFVHLNYLSTLADSALPYLDHPMAEIRDMDARQMDNFKSFGSGSFNFYRNSYQRPENYSQTIKYRKQVFKKKWEKKGFLSWNVAEYQAYEAMFD